MIYRSLALFALLAVVSAAYADPLKYVVYVKEEKVGTLEEETTGDDTNGYVDESTLELTSPEGKKTSIHEIVRYGKDGVVTSKSEEITSDAHTLKVKATLGDDGAKCTVWTDDDKTEKQVPLASKTSRADPTNFWFKSSKPDPGASVTYQSFDENDGSWADVTLKFFGKDKVKVKDDERELNRIDRTEGDQNSSIWVDDKGDAVVIQDGEMRMVRQDKPA